MQLAISFETRADPATAYAYLADFAHIAEWDPFIVRADRLSGGEPRVGSAYRIIGRLLGREIVLDYRTVALDPPRLVRLAGRAGTAFDGWDQMTLAPGASGGTTVRYEAEIRLHGRARLLWLLAPAAWLAMRIGFGRGPIDRLRRSLDGLAPQQGGSPP